MTLRDGSRAGTGIEIDLQYVPQSGKPAWLPYEISAVRIAGTHALLPPRKRRTAGL